MRLSLGALLGHYVSLKHSIQLRYCYRFHRRALKKLKNKSTIRCVFFATFEETWKYDDVYRLMQRNERFDPVILVCPIVNYGYDNMIQRMNQCYSFFKQKRYSVQMAYDVEQGSYLNVRKIINPDIIFYTNPYLGLIDNRYFVTEFRDVLTVYVPYFFNDTADYELAYDEYLMNVVWRRYLETNMHLSMAKKYSRNCGINAVVTGYPGIEPFLKNKLEDVHAGWKIKDRSFKRIIWAPHHSIYATDQYKYASFLMFSDVMVELANKYKDQVQFAFKPHPLLRNKLENVWGKEKTEKYYLEWAQMPNTTIVEGDYVDLFWSSDAMIHDSGSFIAEYLYLNKPVMRTLNGIDLSTLHNQFGLRCLDSHYKARTAEEIEVFIKNVINGVDPLKAQRTESLSEFFKPQDSPSHTILDDLLARIVTTIPERN